MAEQTKAIREQVDRTCEDVGGELRRQIQVTRRSEQQKYGRPRTKFQADSGNAFRGCKRWGACVDSSGPSNEAHGSVWVLPCINSLYAHLSYFIYIHMTVHICIFSVSSFDSVRCQFFNFRHCAFADCQGAYICSVACLRHLTRRHFEIFHESPLFYLHPRFASSHPRPCVSRGPSRIRAVYSALRSTIYCV